MEGEPPAGVGDGRMEGSHLQELRRDGGEPPAGVGDGGGTTCRSWGWRDGE
jgi:hypothetical protein